MVLAQKPLRVSKGRPVLRANKRYRFTGRLTCVVNGNRRLGAQARSHRPAQHGRQETIEKSGTTVRAKGAFQIILAYPSSRLITFRFTNSDGQRSQVRIRVSAEEEVARR